MTGPEVFSLRIFVKGVIGNGGDRPGGLFHRFSFLLFLPAALAGCFDYNQQVVVEKSGAATFNVDVIIPAFVISLLQSDGSTFQCADNFHPLPKPGVTFETGDFTRANNRICRLTARGRLADLDDIQFDQNGEAKPSGLRVTKLNGDRYRLESTLAELSEDPDFADLMASALVQGHYWRFEIRAPKILSTNGEIVDNGKRARWQRPLADLFVANPEGDMTFTAEIETAPSPWDRIGDWLTSLWRG